MAEDGQGEIESVYCKHAVVADPTGGTVINDGYNLRLLCNVSILSNKHKL